MEVRLERRDRNPFISSAVGGESKRERGCRSGEAKKSLTNLSEVEEEGPVVKEEAKWEARLLIDSSGEDGRELDELGMEESEKDWDGIVFLKNDQ
jgi:hypothetical protein